MMHESLRYIYIWMCSKKLKELFSAKLYRAMFYISCANLGVCDFSGTPIKEVPELPPSRPKIIGKSKVKVKRIK